MRFSTTAIISAILGAAAVSAETFNVLVGKGGSVTYEPSQVQAKVGDIIAFQFLAKNHTVTQSTFTSPCVPKSEGASAVTSGFQFVPGGADKIPQWSITINNDTAPLWFFCGQAAHCKAGMVFAVNPNAEKTFEAFLANAAAGGGATSGPNAATGAPVAPAGSSAINPAASPAASSAADTAGGAIGPVAAAANAGNSPSGIAENQTAAPGSGALSSANAKLGWAVASMIGVAVLL